MVSEVGQVGIKQGIKAMQSTNQVPLDSAFPVQVVAIASANNPSKATEFAEKLAIAKVHETYEQLMQDPEVDVVYVATGNAYHYAAVRRAIELKKPVLCEKPFTTR